MKKTLDLSVLLGMVLILVLFLLLSFASTRKESLVPGSEQNKEPNVVETPSTTSSPQPGVISGEPPSREPTPEEIKKRKEETERGPGKEPPLPQVEQPEPPAPGSQTTAP